MTSGAAEPTSKPLRDWRIPRILGYIKKNRRESRLGRATIHPKRKLGARSDRKVRSRPSRATIHPSVSWVPVRTVRSAPRKPASSDPGEEDPRATRGRSPSNARRFPERHARKIPARRARRTGRKAED